MWVRLLPPARDAAIVGVLLVAGEIELHLSYATASSPDAGQMLMTLLIAVPLAWRRVLPLAACTVTMAAFALEPAVVTPVNSFASALIFAFAVYSVAAHASSWEAAVAGGVVAVGLGITWSVLDPDPQNEAVSNAIFTALAWTAGAVVRQHQLTASSARSEAEQQRLAADAHAAAVVHEERARIARELHDVVAHAVAVTVLQARGGRKVLNADPAAAMLAFDDIEKLSAQSLAELRRLVGFLRQDVATNDQAGDSCVDARPVPAPQPGLEDLDRLVHRVRAAGLDTEVTVDGGPRELPPGLDLAVYRIAQEGLTNVLRHSPGTRACLRICWEPNTVTIHVTNNGPPVPTASPGHGLTGMRERVALYGGTLTYGPLPPGGFAVRARFPVPA